MRRSACLCAGLVLGLTALMATAATHADRPARMPANRPTLYVSNERGSDVVALDVASGTLQGSAKVGVEPEGVAVSPNGKEVYVACEGSSVVVVVDRASLTEITRISTQHSASGLLQRQRRAPITMRGHNFRLAAGSSSSAPGIVLGAPSIPASTRLLAAGTATTASALCRTRSAVAIRFAQFRRVFAGFCRPARIRDKVLRIVDVPVPTVTLLQGLRSRTEPPAIR